MHLESEAGVLSKGAVLAGCSLLWSYEKKHYKICKSPQTDLLSPTLCSRSESWWLQGGHGTLAGSSHSSGEAYLGGGHLEHSLDTVPPGSATLHRTQQ